jgi:hypothetical protein
VRSKIGDAASRAPFFISLIAIVKILLFILTSIVQIAGVVPGFLILLLALNGFSERDATPAIVGYIVLSVAIVLGCATLSVLTAKKLVERKRLNQFVASVIGLIGFSSLGFVLIAVNLFLAIGIAELFRKV